MKIILITVGILAALALIVACIAVVKRYNGWAMGGFIAFFPRDYPRCQDLDCETCDELCLNRGSDEPKNPA